mgnify:CR=1 FL=1
MPNKAVISTESAPAAIGTYSQAIKVNNTVYLSGQIPLVPESMKMVEGDFAAQAEQVFLNLQAVCQAANGDLQDIVKLNIYLTDLTHFPMVNEIMAIENYGHPMRVTEYPEHEAGPCTWYIFRSAASATAR